VLSLAVPPLRELEGDKEALLEHFRKRYAAQPGAQPFTLDENARERWLRYPFPGNVRELRNIVIRLTTKYAGQRLSPAELEPELDLESPLPGQGSEAGAIVDQALRLLEHGGPFNLDDTLKAWERGYIEAALRLTRGNVSQAAKLLGVNRTTLYSLMNTEEEK
jgi:DNA-binding NtrC family response regulator